MRLDVHLHSGREDEILELLAGIYEQLSALRGEETSRMRKISRDMVSLEQQVRTNGDVTRSAIILINGLAEKLAAAGTDPAKLDAIQAELKVSADALAAAVAANTPAAPPGPVTPPEPV